MSLPKGFLRVDQSELRIQNLTVVRVRGAFSGIEESPFPLGSAALKPKSEDRMTAMAMKSSRIKAVSTFIYHFHSQKSCHSEIVDLTLLGYSPYSPRPPYLSFLPQTYQIMNIEAIIAIVALVVALPPSLFVVYKWVQRSRRRRNRHSCKSCRSHHYLD